MSESTYRPDLKTIPWSATEWSWREPVAFNKKKAFEAVKRDPVMAKLETTACTQRIIRLVCRCGLDARAWEGELPEECVKCGRPWEGTITHTGGVHVLSNAR
ncbi:MAG: hypothetical protein QOI20_3259 [Acidimicrobiaceae bacterium]|jgi:hypothetical protein|nr:hypothetical protein [Acidimicrobiaceae bacterium]